MGARCGFTAPAHFTRAFRSAYGVSPSEYRKAEHRQLTKLSTVRATARRRRTSAHSGRVTARPTLHAVASACGQDGGVLRSGNLDRGGAVGPRGVAERFVAQIMYQLRATEATEVDWAGR
ncbi:MULTISPECIES: AraC family transcriptional regulator [Streptomyces]|uniref:helix-turn-helix domain-containing protein n=1 Tax=Streptomyces TaxID=1883 RepID=UPI00211BEE9E|nr:MULTISPECIES: AraC family transcriptional regulator [Streptomyces]MDN3248565.1 AraC family transcriptional regulator [Streptomyces sp. ZSW22]MDN3256116.1 AraC family transcriptional regulator [Streptomyces sp. MA25(2023)]